MCNNECDGVVPELTRDNRREELQNEEEASDQCRPLQTHQSVHRVGVLAFYSSDLKSNVL